MRSLESLPLQRAQELLHDPRVQPNRPLVAVFGGVKLAHKLDAIAALAGHADQVLVGGTMSYTFLAARGIAVGDSPVEQRLLDTARRVLDRAGERVLLPSDHIVLRGYAELPRTLHGAIPAGCAGYDIGPRTTALFCEAIERASTVVWSGPMGRFEDPRFRDGTDAVARAVATFSGVSVVGGGKTGEALRALELDTRVSHLSRGGIALLAFLTDGALPRLDD